MAKKKVCKQCRRIHDESECPACGSNLVATSHNGRLFVTNPEKSFIGQQMGIKKEGEYAIKVR